MEINGHNLNERPELNGRNIDLSQAATNIVTIEQIVEYRQSQAATNIVTVEQDVRGRQAATNIVTIEQRVIDPANIAVNTCNWKKPVVHIAGALVDPGTITGIIEVSRSENNASLASVTVKQACGSIDPDEFQGSDITIDVDDAGTIKRIYTGIIDIPEVDVIRGRITYRCTDRRKELINNQLGTVKSSIGYYSSTIFGEVKDTFEEVEYRLQTTMESVDFDAFGNYTLTSLNPKATADYTVSGTSDVYRDAGNDPRVSLTSRARVINKVNIDFGYRYPKLYHWEAGYSWTHPAANSFCDSVRYGYDIPTREMIRTAASSTNWTLKSDPSFTDIWPAGFYNCDGGTVALTHAVCSGTTAAVTDAEGNALLDDNGQQVYETVDRSCRNNSGLYALGASFALTNRWSQTIEEGYTFTVQAPQSQTKFGNVEQNARYGLQSEYDTEAWEAYEGYTSSFEGTTISGNTIIDRDVNRQAANTAIITALNRAKTTILKSHRDNRVQFVRAPWPEIDLKHTVRLNSTKIDVTGKVSEIRHTFDISNRKASTTVELSFSQSEGSASDSSLSVPTAPTYTATQVASSVGLGNHFGTDPESTNNSANWTGMIGNKYVYESAGAYQNIYKTTFGQYFVVKAPSIQDEARANKTLTQSSSYNVEIPNDSFSVTNGCKC